MSEDIIDNTIDLEVLIDWLFRGLDGWRDGWIHSGRWDKAKYEQAKVRLEQKDGDGGMGEGEGDQHDCGSGNFLKCR